MAGELVEMLEKLPEREFKRLKELEAIVKEDLKAFLRVGAALAEISNSRLYRHDYHTFPEYLKGRWDLGESHGYRLIDAHVVVDKLKNSPIGEEMKTSPNGGGFVLPQNERQIRPLIKYKDDPEKLAQIWSQALETAPNGRVTAKHVQLTLFNVLGEDTKESTGKLRKNVRKDDTVSPAFKAAHEALMQELEREKMSRYKTSSRRSIINHLDGLRAVVSEDGDMANSHWDKSDMKKLTAAGFTLFRKRLVDLDEQKWLIEKADNKMPRWQFVINYEDEGQCDAQLEDLTRGDKSLRC